MIEKIKEYCKDKGCTIDEFERVLGFGKNFVYKLDKHQPSVKAARKIAIVLETTIEELLS